MSHREDVWLGVSRLHFLIPALPLMRCATLGRLLYGNFSFVFCVMGWYRCYHHLPYLLPGFFSPKNQLKSLRCKYSVNYSASQEDGDNVSLVYSWMYQSGTNIAWTLAVFFSVFKILAFCFRKVKVTSSPGFLKKMSLGIVSVKEKTITYTVFPLRWQQFVLQGEIWRYMYLWILY